MKQTKDDILDAAIMLFNTHGFTGTSIRDIAHKAGTNVSNISYYFQNKHGLLETCLTTYFEGYLEEIEKGFHYSRNGALGKMQKMTENILHYHSKHLQLTRLAMREISIDSQMIREIMSTYLVKERYFLKNALEEGIRSKEFQSFSINYMIVQYKSLLCMPFLNPYYLSEVLQIFPNEQYFVRKYYQELCIWLKQALCYPCEELLPAVLT